LERAGQLDDLRGLALLGQRAAAMERVLGLRQRHAIGQQRRRGQLRDRAAGGLVRRGVVHRREEDAPDPAQRHAPAALPDLGGSAARQRDGKQRSKEENGPVSAHRSRAELFGAGVKLQAPA
jgi:hypothetical protein